MNVFQKLAAGMDVDMMFPEYQVIFLPCRADLAFTSSSIIKEVAYYGGDISRMCVPEIEDMVKQKLFHKQQDM